MKLESVAFVGETLGPFFTHDPKLDEDMMRPLFEAVISLDATAVAHEWPFVGDEDALQALSLMQEGLAKGPVDPDLYWEYRRLFVGPLKKAAPPWGSVYMDKEQVMFGPTTMALRDWMRHNGIAMQKKKGDEPEDSIGTMLLIMAYCARQRASALPEFLQLHFLTWSDHFLTLMEEATTHPFYRGLAQLTNASLHGIQGEFNLEVEYPRFYR